MAIALNDGLRQSTKLSLRDSLAAQLDPDARRYILEVEAADGARLETGARLAINAFVRGCKQDGIWNAIKASCILAGARTLNGALVPLVGTAPTNFNFVAGDYSRKTGLYSGTTRTKYLDSNRLANADPQNNRHFSLYLSNTPPETAALFGSAFNATKNQIFNSNLGFSINVSQSAGDPGFSTTATRDGFVGGSRSSSSQQSYRYQSETRIASTVSTPCDALSNLVFARNLSTGANLRAVATVSFYSIGESLDLALLDARVTDLMNAIGAAIP